jgi:hypothetical protein
LRRGLVDICGSDARELAERDRLASFCEDKRIVKQRPHVALHTAHAHQIDRKTSISKLLRRQAVSNRRSLSA